MAARIGGASWALLARKDADGKLALTLARTIDTLSEPVVGRAIVARAKAGDEAAWTVFRLEGRGMERVWGIVEEYRARLTASGEITRRRREQQRAWFWTMIDDGLKGHFLAREDVKGLLPEMEAAVANAQLTPTAAARRLLELLDTGDPARERPPSRPRRAKRA